MDACPQLHGGAGYGNEYPIARAWRAWRIFKRAPNRPDFTVEPDVLRNDLIASHYGEIDPSGRHCPPVRHLPPIHRNPFDRVLPSQASIERLTFMTSAKILARYPRDIMLVGRCVRC